MSKCSKSIQVAFTGITFNDAYGFGQDVNQSYSIRLSPHGGHSSSPGCTYLDNHVVNGVGVVVLVTLSDDGNWVQYDLTKDGAAENVFDNAGPIQGLVQDNTLPGGGTATITVA